MSWQQQVVDTGLEVDPETGLMAYREIIVTVMRQQGKTAGIVLPIEVDRALMWDTAQSVSYTAQTGSDARKKLLEDQAPVLERSILAKTIRRVYRAAGNEGISFKNGSRIAVAASSDDSGHGFTVDLGVLDEFWKDEDDRREQAMLPAMSTRPNAQLLLTSTMGTDRSTYLNRKVETGRHSVASGRDRGIAYFEWSIPLDADIENPETWWQYMPALGWTISETAVAHALETMEEAEWRRAFGNQPTRAEHDQIIPSVFWETAQRPLTEVERSAKVFFGLDVLPDRSAGSIVASDGKSVELVEHRSGTGWMAERVQHLMESWQGTLVIDGGGPAASAADDLAMLGHEVERLTSAEVAAACACMFDALADQRVAFRTSDEMSNAVSGLARRPVGDRFVWSRSASRTDITPFMAATLAYERAIHATEEPQVAFYSFA